MQKNRYITTGAIVIGSILFTLLFKWWTTGVLLHPSTLLFNVIILVTFLTALGIGNSFFRTFLNRPVKQLKRRVIPVFVLFLIIILFVSLLIIGLFIYLYHLVMGLDTTDLMKELVENEFPGAIRYYLLFTVFGSLFFFYTIWRQAIDREQKLREENLKYRYRTLKTQVNPHFLFNSLNTLSEIMYVDINRADNFLQKLAGVYRFILDHEENDLISLHEELEFVEQYFRLQKERSGNKVCLDIAIEDPHTYSIIPVSLQILIENALKHNSASEEIPLIIKISLTEEYVVVSNPIRKKSILHQSSGTGLSNLAERVKLIMDKEMIVSHDANQFIVKLPVKNTRNESSDHRR